MKPSSSSPSRRRFIKTGLFGALALAAIGGSYRLIQGAPRPSPYVFDDEAQAALRAISATLLKGAINEGDSKSLDVALQATQTAVSTLPLSTQKEIADLFGLLTLGATRRLLVGVPDDWRTAKAEDVAAFLQSWRFHRIGLLQSGYVALHDLVLGPWYAEELSWARIGYPGPMKGF